MHSEERVKNEKSKLEDPVNLEEDSTEITDCVLTEGKNQLEVKNFSLVVNNDHLNSDIGNEQDMNEAVTIDIQTDSNDIAQDTIIQSESLVFIVEEY